MESNNIRNYDEIINNSIISSTRYIEKIIPIRTDEDRDACLRLLTIDNNNVTLCQGYIILLNI